MASNSSYRSKRPCFHARNASHASISPPNNKLCYLFQSSKSSQTSPIARCLSPATAAWITSPTFTTESSPSSPRGPEMAPKPFPRGFFKCRPNC